jgi:hypothetical protein
MAGECSRRILLRLAKRSPGARRRVDLEHWRAWILPLTFELRWPRICLRHPPNPTPFQHRRYSRGRRPLEVRQR